MSEGTFNEKPYSNYVFYFTDTDDASAVGTVPLFVKGKPLTFKIKTSQWDLDYPGEKPQDYVNCEVDLQKNLYDQVSSMVRK